MKYWKQGGHISGDFAQRYNGDARGTPHLLDSVGEGAMPQGGTLLDDGQQLLPYRLCGTTEPRSVVLAGERGWPVA